MDSYKSLYEQAKKADNVRPLTAEYKKFEKKGDSVLGRLVGVTPVASTLGGGEYNQYLMETDEGLVKFALGRAGDSEIGAVMKVEKIYYVEFQGQEDIAGGRRVNKFKCEEVGFGEEVATKTGEGK